MKHRGLLLPFIFVFSGAVQADSVPDGIRKFLETTQARVVMLHEGVLWVSYGTPLVTDDLYHAQIKGLCEAPLVNKKYSWGRARVERVEIVNDVGGQGFALMGGRASCEALNRMAWDDADKKLIAMTRPIRAGRVQE